MQKAGWVSIAVAMLLSGAAVAQDRGKDEESATAPTAKQSAPAESPDASGHDVQTGKPETGEGPPEQNQDKKGVETKAGEEKRKAGELK
ncbi:MAG: hypothetical protein IT539_07610 [Bradyrhizobiaceae bacterium]|nr:hypothetical protein [Bradyrhizobiaceae bacterium]